MQKQSSVILIGMPGSGKSTLGALLARELSQDFIDIDTLIQYREKKTLQQIINESGHLNFQRIEGEVMATENLPNHVVATGGSAIYSVKGMENLLNFGPAVFLSYTLQELYRRMGNYESRGIARAPGQSLSELFSEREALYRRYADIVVDCNGKDIQYLLHEIISKIRPC